MTAYSAELRGVPVGAGSLFRFESAPSGFGSPSAVTSRLQRPWSDGSMPLGPDTLPSRMVAFAVFTDEMDPAVAEVLAGELSAAWAPVRDGTVELTVELSAGPFVLFGRPVSAPVDHEWLPQGVVRARLVFEATDPRLFSATEYSLVLGLTPGGGVTAPVTAPVTAGAGSDSDGVAVNAGTFETEWVATIVGPVMTPRLTLGETAQFVELDGTVPAGSTLVVSSVDGSVLLNGSPRPGWATLPSRFFKLPAGPSTLRFRAASGSGSCTFVWRDAKI